MPIKRTRASAASARKTILVVDDHPMTREGVANLLRREPGLAVCGAVGTAKAALAALSVKSPDLVLTDLSLTDHSGLELIKEAHCLHPEVPVLVFSMHYESLYAERVLRAGARGYIMKSEGAAKLLDAVHRVLRGEVYLSDVMRDHAVHRFTRGTGGTQGNNAPSLSDRELEVFELIGHAHSTREISRRLGVSSSTVETHRAHIKQKLNLRSSTELVHAAIEWVARSRP